MSAAMTLRVVTPTGVVVDAPVRRLVAEATEGSFGVLPRHADFVAALVPGVLAYVDDGGEERFLGVNRGTFVKCGADVLVAVRDAVPGEDLATLERHVATAFRRLDERERAARSALARLEAGIVRRLVDLEREAP